MFSENDRRIIRERLAPMPRGVTLVHFTQELACPLCAQTRLTLEQLVELAGPLTLEVHDFQRDVPAVAAYGIDMPRTIVDGIDAVEGVLPEEAYLDRILGRHVGAATR